MKVKEESERVGLKLDTQKTKIMASDPITLQKIDGETVTDFVFVADGDYSHETPIALWKKSYDKPRQHI